MLDRTSRSPVEADCVVARRFGTWTSVLKSNDFNSRGNTIASGQCELNILNEAQRSAAQPEEQPPAK
jgi:hypothetical protein